MNKIANQFSSIEQVTDRYLKNNRQTAAVLKEGQRSFREILTETQSGMEPRELRFSKHASARLLNRNIELSTEQKQRLENGAEKAEAKGIKESLVLVDSLAFIVNIPSRTVVTAMDQAETSGSIYTNIDGAVII